MKTEEVQINDAYETAKKAVVVCDSKKAFEIKMLKVSEKTVIADYFVICTCNTASHVKGVCDEIEFKLGEDAIHPIRSDGLDNSVWGVLDYGSVMIHVFEKNARKFYNLERLWSEAEEIDIKSLLSDD